MIFFKSPGVPSKAGAGLTDLLYKSQLLFQCGIQYRQFSALDQEAGEPGYFSKNVVLVQSAFQVIAAGAATGTYSAADHAMHHAHMSISPGAELLIYFKQVVEQL